ncbi:unnamed protein product [Ilex paraguariensis]|uniref:GATA transcription factor n=1 Tax=Ilex paraguariensis TaxID=185542 RepID=A0ABC8V4W3_9AQUA
MDMMYGGLSTLDYFRIEDLLDFSNDVLFSSTTPDHHHLPSYANSSAAGTHSNTSNPNRDFTDDLCVPNDDIAQLEWPSTFVDDALIDYPSDSFAGTLNVQSNTCSFHNRSKSSSTSRTSSNSRIIPNTKSKTDITYNNNTDAREKGITRDRSTSTVEVARRCTHCASEKTPQWRTGPMGPKTLCNACGVRFKSGRLVPEYRPATSPTFVLTQHSNSHRKVLQLRRQKELIHQQQQQQNDQRQTYDHHDDHHHGQHPRALRLS